MDIPNSLWKPYKKRTRNTETKYCNTGCHSKPNEKIKNTYGYVFRAKNFVQHKYKQYKYV